MYISCGREFYSYVEPPEPRDKKMPEKKNREEDTTAEITFLVTVCYLCINNHDDRYDSISSDNIFRRQLCFGHDMYQKVERASIGFQIKRKIMDSH